jgi:hypothetical protein
MSASVQGGQKVRERFSHCPNVRWVCRIALKPTPLDFSDHVLSNNVIRCVKNIQKVRERFSHCITLGMSNRSETNSIGFFRPFSV